MLSQIQKLHLNKVLKHYNFQYLRPPPDVYTINHPENQHFLESDESTDKRRHIFYRVKYEVEEERALIETKQELKRKKVEHKLNDEVILKHIYAGNWDIDKVVQRLKKLIAYQSNPTVTRFDQQTIRCLQKGQIYTYGHDKQFRPIIVMRMDRFDVNQNIDQHFNSIFYIMIVVRAFRMVPYHAEKNILIIDLNSMNLARMPFKYMWNALERLQVYYCANMQRIFVYNAGGVGNLWNMVSYFLHQSQKKRINFIKEGEKRSILEHIDEYQLQKKYGGKLPDLTEYWPPKETHQSFQLKMNQTLNDSEYHSVQNDQSFFQTEAQGSTCSNATCSCDIY